MADRFIEVSLVKRGNSIILLKLLYDRAPVTCAAVWDALPLGGDVYHAKYARNEKLHALFPPFAKSEPPLENPTVMPIPGDLCYFAFAGTELGTKAYGYDTDDVRPGTTVVDLALFYERNNLLLNGDVGWVRASSGAR